MQRMKSPTAQVGSPFSTPIGVEIIAAAKAAAAPIVSGIAAVEAAQRRVQSDAVAARGAAAARANAQRRAEAEAAAQAAAQARADEERRRQAALVAELRLAERSARAAHEAAQAAERNARAYQWALRREVAAALLGADHGNASLFLADPRQDILRAQVGQAVAALPISEWDVRAARAEAMAQSEAKRLTDLRTAMAAAQAKGVAAQVRLGDVVPQQREQRMTRAARSERGAAGNARERRHAQRARARKS